MNFVVAKVGLRNRISTFLEDNILQIKKDDIHLHSV